jgi:dTDP-4-amino-4,6-dideoxygalactose transaminase
MIKMKIEHNFLPKQYERTGIPSINHNYLKEQFSDYKEIFKEIEVLVKNCDFTLGKAVNDFEEKICSLTGAKYTIGVGSGTDAIFLSLKALGIGRGDEVITTPYTFYATIGAIVTAGAKPVFVDIKKDYNINPSLIEGVITSNTKAILPVHWSGLCCDMDEIMAIAQKHNLSVVEDACHTINAKYKGKATGTFGNAGCFSLHPLKNINVWGDGGFIVTNSEGMHDRLVLLRNHGLINRNECKVFGYNSRLDSIQATVANHLLKKINDITESRIKNAHFFDEELKKIPEITVTSRDPNIKHVFHIYVIKVKDRDRLQQYLIENGIDAKVHYPIPMHLQPAAKEWGYKEGDFPIAESTCKSVLSLPVHEFITREQQEYIIKKIKKFYNEFRN